MDETLKSVGGEFVHYTLEAVVDTIADVAKKELARRHGVTLPPEFGVRSYTEDEVKHGALDGTVGDEAIDLSSIDVDQMPKE